MSAYVGPALFALFAWWFSTGAIIYLDGLPVRTFRWSMLGGSLVAALSFWGLWRSAGDPGLGGAYFAFASALGVWAWHEMSFYMGYVTGPRRHQCEEGCGGLRHLGHAVQVSLWHELAIIAAFAAIVALTWNAPNKIGLWTFAIMWGMHESARLNVVLGVRNVSEQFLPAHLSYLKSFLNKKPMNPLFPFSVTAATGLFGVLTMQAALAEGPAQQAGLAFFATVTAIGVMEHWFLVLPLRSEALWEWGMASRTREVPDPLLQDKPGPRMIHAHGPAASPGTLHTVH